MRFENFFEEQSKKENELENVKIIGYLQKNCYGSNCTGIECKECVSCVTDDVTLKDLHCQILDVLLNPDLTDEISIDKKVIECAIKNTVKSVSLIREDFERAKESALIQTTPDFINTIQNNMESNIDLHTVLTLLKFDNR